MEVPIGIYIRFNCLLYQIVLPLTVNVLAKMCIVSSSVNFGGILALFSVPINILKMKL